MNFSDSKTQNRCAIGILAVVMIALFAWFPYASGYGSQRRPIAYWLWYFWRSPEWQHGALVPIIVGALIWRKRESLANIELQGSSIGLVVVGLSLLLFLAGYRSNIYYLGYASCHSLIIGLTLWIGGWKWIRALAFPLCFLAFLWPLFFLESQIGFPLRMMMTNLSSGILNLIGIEHLKLGTAIVSVPEGRFALEVANPCSGIRSLFALIMIGGLYGHLSLPEKGQWIVMSLSAIPLAIAGNVVRIMVLTGGSMAFGTEFAVGTNGETSTFHFFAGIAVFLTALLGMFFFGKVLSRTGRSRKSAPESVLIDNANVPTS